LSLILTCWKSFTRWNDPLLAEELRPMSLSRRAFLQMSTAAALVRWRWRSLRVSDAKTTSLCHHLQSDPLRPQFHLLPAANWMNDPNGPIFFRGQYHMFHQYNPEGAVWGNMHWAHAVSPDIVHWTHEPIAIRPTPNGFDRDGVFSGSAVLDGDVPTVIYTGVLPPSSDAEATLRDGKHTWREVQCLAVSKDPALRTWEKLADPVIRTPPSGMAVTGFRDPCVWREDDQWWLALGSGTRERGGAILLYRSTDLRKWAYVHPMIEGGASGKNTTNPVDDGDMWECPDFFALGNKHVLLISTMGKVRWKVGTYRERKFTPEKQGVVDHGAYYAAKSMLDRDGNRILWGWIPETRPETEFSAAGWAGAMGLPRVLWLNSAGELAMEVSPAVRVLRGDHFGLRGGGAKAVANLISNAHIRDLAAELRTEFRAKSSKPVTIRLTDAANKDFASIAVNPGAPGRELNVNGMVAPLAETDGTPVRLHALLDGSVLEVIANQTTSITARIYRASTGRLRLQFEGQPEIRSFDLWQMRAISKNRLTSPLCG
jgi:beta-fructofuranosidase